MALSVRFVTKLRGESQFLVFNKNVQYTFSRCLCQAQTPENVPDPSKDEEIKFPVLILKPSEEKPAAKNRIFYEEKPPRTLKMPLDQDWSNVWPAPKTFHPASVPLPLRQGFRRKKIILPKDHNVELMKIPNFLHLTSPAIEKHCNALKKFCTKWPENLENEKKMAEHFPIEIISYDYCFSGPSIRYPMSGVISLQFKLNALQLDSHAKDKLLRLLGKRYDPKEDKVTITTSSCPLKKQNYEYAHYLLTALYFESWKFEEWEKEKGDEDMENYHFRNRASFRNMKKYFEYTKTNLPNLKKFGKAVSEWHDNGDSREVVEKYKSAALEVLQLSSPEQKAVNTS